MIFAILCKSIPYRDRDMSLRQTMLTENKDPERKAAEIPSGEYKTKGALRRITALLGNYICEHHDRKNVYISLFNPARNKTLAMSTYLGSHGFIVCPIAHDAFLYYYYFSNTLVRFEIKGDKIVESKEKLKFEHSCHFRVGNEGILIGVEANVNSTSRHSFFTLDIHSLKILHRKEDDHYKFTILPSGEFAKFSAKCGKGKIEVFNIFQAEKPSMSLDCKTFCQPINFGNDAVALSKDVVAYQIRGYRDRDFLIHNLKTRNEVMISVPYHRFNGIEFVRLSDNRTLICTDKLFIVDNDTLTMTPVDLRFDAIKPIQSMCGANGKIAVALSGCETLYITDETVLAPKTAVVDTLNTSINSCNLSSNMSLDLLNVIQSYSGFTLFSRPARCDAEAEKVARKTESLHRDPSLRSG